jgi:threonine dehydratase
LKIESTRSLGAHVILTGETYDDAESAAKAWQEKNGGLMIHPFADPNVIAGQGTVALELLEQIDQIYVIICPVGGGGLISGIASVMKTIKPEIKIYGVQTELFPTMTESFKAGHICPQPINPEASLADGIAVKGIKELNFSIIKENVDVMLTVSESQIAGSIMELMERNHLLAEGAGASCSNSRTAMTAPTY